MQREELGSDSTDKEGGVMTERPEFCTNEMLEYLDELRESGETNMYGAGRYLEAEFPDELLEGRSFHSSKKAHAVLAYWMETFSERHGLAEAK